MYKLLLVSIIILSMYTGSLGQWKILNQGIENGYLSAIDFVNNEVGWIIGGRPLFKTENGGDDWFPLPNFGSIRFRVVDFISDSVGWAIGTGVYSPSNNGIFKTKDGGLTWSVSKSAGNLTTLYAVDDS